MTDSRTGSNDFQFIIMNKFSVLLASALLTCGCVSSIGETDTTGQKEEPAVSSLPVFKAGFEDMSTKTYVDGNNHLHWTSDDRLTIFHANTSNVQYRFCGNTGDNSGSFDPVDGSYPDGETIGANYAVFPYSSTTSINRDGVIILTLPSKESYGENSFGVNANTMVAVTENTSDFFLPFKNVCGYIVFKLYGIGTIASITLSGNEGEKLAGKATVAAAYGEAPSTVLDESNCTDTILLDCGEGITIGDSSETATTFWFVVPQVTFSKGFSILVTDTNGATANFKTLKERVITRNSLTRMAALSVDFSTTPPAFNSNGIDALDESDFEW